MKRIFLPLLFAVSVSYGQNNAPGADTTDGSLAEAQLETAADSTATASLDTVRVKAATVVTKIDRKLVFPTGQQIAGAANGVELLRRLMLPRLNVDPVTNSIGILGGGEVQLRINGVKAEQQEIAALQPQDVIRVEYHDNPGIRYGNAAAVVDFIVRRHETGGSAGADINNTFKLKTNGYRNLRAKLNHRKSEFSIYYSGSHSGLEQMWRDNEETFRFADGTTLRRIEEGTPNRHQTASNYFGANYNYQTDKRMLNVGLKNTARNQPHHDFAGKL
ncbi:MAG: hypothetical protein LBH06_08220 [Rikenellaceae bacterium]|jgi:hypothetical protein|nr:hypothetical protein [Rikenellaceae bacterium]